MGFLDTIVGDLVSNAGGGAGVQNVLTNMLGGNQQQGQYQQGGLGGLVSAFEQAGMGHIVQSWIGDGANHPVSPEQLQTVFGDDQVQGMANDAGMAPHDFLAQLAQHLPSVVNAMTPEGRQTGGQWT